MKITKYKSIYVMLLAMACIINTMNAHADPGDLPGGDGGCDPFNPGPGYCPLDTWVVVLAVAAIIFGYLQLKKQKPLAN